MARSNDRGSGRILAEVTDVLGRQPQTGVVSWPGGRTTAAYPQQNGRTMSTTPVLYKVEQAAEMLSLGRSTVFDLIRTGELRSVQIGASRRIPASAITEYVDSLLANPN